MNLQTERKKIFFVIPTLGYGGAERVFVVLANNFDKRKYEIVLCVLNGGGVGYTDDIANDVVLINMGRARVRYSLFALRKIIRAHKPDVIISTLAHLNIALTLFRPMLIGRAKLITRETGIVSQRLKSFSSISAALCRCAYKVYCRFSTEIICQSDVMRNDLIENYGAFRAGTRTINNPIDINVISKLATDISDLEKQKLRDGCEVLFVSVGRMVWVKGFDILIGALARLGDVNFRILIIGEGPLQREIYEQAASLEIEEKIFFMGRQENPFKYMKLADALIMSSRSEGFPNVAIEAIACGTPVISTPSVGGINEAIGDIEECVISNNISDCSLASAIQKWLASERKRVPMWKAGRYSVESIIKIYEKLVDENL